MAESEAPEAGLVIRTLAMFEHALGLARGVPDVRVKEQSAVPRADMVAAHAIAEQVSQQLRRWRADAARVRWPAVTAAYALSRVDAAVSAARRLESELRQIVGGTAPATATSRALAGGWPAVWVREMTLARELLEITAGERPMEGSDIAMAGEEGAHGLLVSIPVLGEAIMVFEAVSGRSVYNWKKLSIVERAFSVLAVIIPFAAGRVARVVGRGVLITKRAVAAAMANTKFAAALARIAGPGTVLRMAIGLRVLPEKHFDELLDLLRAARLNDKQQQRFTFFLSRIDYLWRTAAWLKEAKVQGLLKPGFNVLKGAKPEPKELTALAALYRLSKKRVVALPKCLPEHYQGGAGKFELKDAKFPDGLLDKDLFDLLVVTSSNAGSTIGELAKKGYQANVVVGYISSQSTLTIDGLAAQVAERVWPNPRNMYVDRIILLTENAIREIPRPPAYYALPAEIGHARSALPPEDKLIKAAEEVDAEADPKINPGR